ncbi:unnamed protein product [Ranitomeya imitator]|uniref:Reverse transcriptase domain-containing protein n=1 Tax=Ranitomeya imitator TaxID=111125 RepID=A0ABN9LNX9_9NEOB|nr:unnamed protein product [Ranitomeya imitator]
MTPISDLISDKRPYDNLKYEQRRALDELMKMKEIVFKPSDKGGNIVVWPCTQYEKEALRQLGDPSCYERLSQDPTSAYQKKLFTILDSALEDGIIPKSIWQGLRTESPTVPTLYLLPKVHKSMIDPPGRPIISGNGSLLEPISKFLDFYLKPIVAEIPSYIRDTTEALQRLDGIHMTSDMHIITCDVESLYTSIPHEFGLTAARRYLSCRNLDGLLIEFLMELLEYALFHNYFVFKDRYYLQKRGVAMGAAFAPSYANLFMGSWEHDYVQSEDHAMTGAIVLWMRFIDDISGRAHEKNWISTFNI